MLSGENMKILILLPNKSGRRREVSDECEVPSVVLIVLVVASKFCAYSAM